MTPQQLKKMFLIIVVANFLETTFAQEEDTVAANKGSYLSFGQPAIEDNSMFLEEAFNQVPGIVQHVSNFSFNGKEFVLSYMQEIPLNSIAHQFSFQLSYASLRKPEKNSTLGNFEKGLGDIILSYRFQAWGKNKWALIIPRLSFIIPTGNPQYGLGAGSWGAQLAVAVTKRISRKITTHYNIGYTLMTKVDHYTYPQGSVPLLAYEKNINTKNIAVSTIWSIRSRLNFMIESTATFAMTLQDDGSMVRLTTHVVNPGFRFAIDTGKTQIVPGIGVPIFFSNGVFDNVGTFIYLSVEPSY